MGRELVKGWRQPGMRCRARGWATLALGLAPLVGCASMGTGKAPELGAIYGNVFAVVNGDTVRVEGAKVWTEPLAADAQTDQAGYFRLQNLVPQTYTVLAEAAGGGPRGMVSVPYTGAEVRAAIILGSRQTEWPPKGGKLGTEKVPPPLIGGGVKVVPPGP